MIKRKLLIIACLVLLCSCQNDSSISISDATSFDISESNQEYIEVIKKDYIHEIAFNQEGLTPVNGNVNILLIPISFNDVNKMIDTNLLDIAFNANNNELIDFYSVKQYYEISSYNNIHLNFDILNTYTTLHPSNYYETKNNYVDAVKEIVIESLTYYDEMINYQDYDSNNDGYIDGVYLIYDHDVDYSYANPLWWAFTSYINQNEILFDNLKIKSNVFAGIDFLINKQEKLETHTYIHEMAHMFGLDDYYDTALTKGSEKGGLAGADMMDQTIGDHNSFSKALLGWNNGKIIKESTTIELSSINGDYLILANDFDLSKGLFQEFFILEYYTPTSLNEYDKMFKISGIRMLHVIAYLKKDGTLKYNNSTSNVKLISQITDSKGSTYLKNAVSRSDETLFTLNESLNKVCYANNERLNFTFNIIDLN